jgi:predicted trehalose synthase
MSAAPTVPLPTNGEIASAVGAELERLGQLGSVTGVIALKLARALDDPAIGAAQITSVSQRLLTTLEPLQKLAPREPDKVDEFTRRLLEKQASA